MRSLRRLPHLVFLAAGLVAGLSFALPVDTAGQACPPAGEGRNMCVLQQAWAPAFTTVALCVVLAWLLAELLVVRLPAWRAGERRRKPSRHGYGREAVEADDVLRAASWGVLPPPRRRAPKPAVTVAAVTGAAPDVHPVVRPLDRTAPQARRAIQVVRGNKVEADQAVLVACWDAATRRSAELVDAAAVDLGLAGEELRAAPATDPDPLLTAATWARSAAPRGPGRLRRLIGRRAEPVELPADPLLRAAMWTGAPGPPRNRRAA
jgi:hypothetical protein